MSYIIRGRVTAYDNIASGSATGRELTITGVTPYTSVGTQDNVAVGSSGQLLTQDNVAVGTSEHTSGPLENRFVSQTSYATSLGRPNQERLG